MWFCVTSYSWDLVAHQQTVTFQKTSILSNTAVRIKNLTPESLSAEINHTFSYFQHANEDVEKMILGNKNDMDEKRVVSRERGEGVSIVTVRGL
jgi:uncharacterized protein YwgA